MTVSSSTNRVSYAGNGSTTVFPYTYKIFDQDDLTVILRAANGTETVKLITSDYTVSGVGSAGGGNVTMLVAPATGQTLVILREQDLVQELDIVPNDPFPADSLEGALDKLTFMVQQQQDALNRSIKASRTNTISSTEFTISAASRANKIFAFDASGDLSITQELGTNRGDWAASTAYNQRDIVKDGGNDNLYFCNTSHTSSGSLPISTNTDAAKWDLLLDVSAFTTLYDQFDDRYLGAKNSDPATDNDGNTLIDGALYWNTTDNQLKVYDLGNTAWVFTAPTSTEQTAINAVVAIAADVSAVAAIDANVTTVAGISPDVTTVAANVTDVTNFADVYVGPSATDPATRSDSSALQAGDLYFNTATDQMFVYDGSVWAAASFSNVNPTFTSVTTTSLTVNGNNYPSAGSLGHRNKIINGAMQVSQRATSFSGGTANADDAYTLDRWYILSEGSDSVDVDQIADSPDTGGKCLRLDVETTGEKFGIAQIVEAVNCTGLIGNTVTLSFAAKVSDARIDTIKAGIVAWSGTADTVTSDIVSSWGADGTTPTLIANATFENTPADLGVTTSWATYTVTANVDTASTANLILFIWSDDATNPLAGDFLYVTNVQLEAGDTATPFEHRSYGQELALCQRYYYDPGGIFLMRSGGYSVNARAVGSMAPFPTTMRAAPTITTANVVHSGTNSLSVANIQTNQWEPNITVAIDGNALAYFNYTASAEL